jgi:hypothetical protein
MKRGLFCITPKTVLIVALLFAGLVTDAQTLQGKYTLVKDSDGKSPKNQAVISLTFAPGTFKLKAAMPGQTVEDNGTYKITGNNITIIFKEMEQGKQTGPFTNVDGTLTLPFKMLSNEKGSSTWQKEGTLPAAATVVTGTVPQIIAQTLADAKSKAKYYEQVDKNAATTAKKLKGNMAQAYYINAMVCYFKNLRPDALYGYAKAAQLQPTNGLFLNNLALLLMDNSKYGDAIALLKEVTRTFPNLASPVGNLAIAYYKTNDMVRADSANRIARRIDPQNGLYCYTDGKIKEKKGKKEEAQKSFEEAWDLGYAGEGREGAKGKNASVAKSPTPVKSSKPNTNKPKTNKPQTKEEKLAQWEGHYEAEVASARSGETAADANTKFGDGLGSTNINLQTLACAKEFSMDITRMGNISGTGKVLYVYQGGAAAPAMGMIPAPVAGTMGGFTTNLKDGFQIRDWSFSGTIDEEGNVEINGMPSGELDLLNVGKWQKIKTWSPLPPDGPGAAMKGPFHMKMKMDEKGVPFITVNQYLALNDKLIRRVHYQAFIVRTDGDIAPKCDGPQAPEPAKCAATESIKTKVTFSPNDVVSIEASNTFTKGPNGVQSQQEMGVNVTGSLEIGPVGAGVEFHPSDNSYELSVGVGVDTEDLLKGSPISFGEKLDLIYDSKCGWGVKASAGLKNKFSSTSYSVEGVIFFNKGL